MHPIIYNAVLKYGYGDILVGLVSTFLIAKAKSRPFIINFEIKMDKIFDNVYYYNLKNKNNISIHNHINPESKGRVISFLNKKPDKIDIIMCNQAWYTIFYKNDLKCIRSTWQDLYSNILKLNSEFINDSKKFLNILKTPLIGIQIRCGDYSWSNNDNIYLKPKKFKKVIYKIIDWYNKYCNLESIYLTCDNKHFIKLAHQIFKLYNIKSYSLNDIPKHFIHSTKDEIYDIIMDHYLLSHSSKFLICKQTSNYGLTSALISNSNDIWTFNKDYDSIKKIKFTKYKDFIKG